MPSSPLRFASGFVDITPDWPSSLAGFSSRSNPSDGVFGALEANVLVLFDGTTHAVLISTDLLYFGSDLRQKVAKNVRDVIPDDALFCVASHTHFAPATSRYLPGLGAQDRRYVAFAAERISTLVRTLALASLSSATITYHAGSANHSVNRRKLRRTTAEDDWPHRRIAELKPNLRGLRDESIRVFAIRDEKASVRSVVWNYACHPVSFPDRHKLCAEFPGVVRARLRSHFGPELPVLFLQGYAGDVRPRAIDRPTTLRGAVRGLLNQRYWSEFSFEQWRDWADSLGSRVVATLQKAPRQSYSGPLDTGRHVTPVSVLVDRRNGGDDREISVQRITIGEELNFVGISAEPVTAYRRHLDRVFPRCLNVPVGYLDEVYGYIPTDRMLDEGGYEVNGFLPHFAHDGVLHSDQESRFVEQLRSLAGQNGLPPA